MEWTKEEVRKLIEVYDKHSYEELGEMFGRSWRAIQCKANGLRLYKRKKRFYTEKEDEFIKRNVKRLGTKKVGELLGRTEQSVHCRYQKIGVRLSDNLWDEETKARFIADYPDMDNYDLAEKYGLQRREQVIARAQRYGVHKSEEFMRKMQKRKGWRIKMALAEPEVRAKMERTMWKKGTDVGKNTKFSHDRKITKEAVAKMRKTRQQIIDDEKKRIRWGQPQKTKMILKNVW